MTPTGITTRAATEGDLLSLPEHLVGEIIDGELLTHARPRLRHARVQGTIHSRVRTPYDDGAGGPGGWWILFEPQVRFGKDVLAPDLAGWRRDRLPELPDVATIEISPDWVCEVLSPRTERTDRSRKLPIYARAAVAHVWLVNPKNHTLEVLRRHKRSWLVAAVYEGGAVVRPEPFDAIDFDLASVWGPARTK